MVWVYGVGTSSKGIWCGLLYAVDDRSPHHIQPVLHGIYMVWGYAVGAHEFYRCGVSTWIGVRVAWSDAAGVWVVSALAVVSVSSGVVSVFVVVSALSGVV